CRHEEDTEGSSGRKVVVHRDCTQARIPVCGECENPACGECQEQTGGIFRLNRSDGYRPERSESGTGRFARAGNRTYHRTKRRAAGVKGCFTDFACPRVTPCFGGGGLQRYPPHTRGRRNGRPVTGRAGAPCHFRTSLHGSAFGPSTWWAAHPHPREVCRRTSVSCGWRRGRTRLYGPGVGGSAFSKVIRVPGPSRGFRDCHRSRRRQGTLAECRAPARGE